MYDVGSLFSGVGGIELGFERAGFTTKWFVECEPYAQTILKKRFPKAKIYGDIKEIDFATVPRVDILTGGFPCQDISNAGKRAGIEGSRSSLWKYFFKAISKIRPRIAFIENVSALRGRGLDVVLCDLSKIGYDAEWHCVPTSTIGANHQRDRIFILAYPSSHGFQDPGKNERRTDSCSQERGMLQSTGRSCEADVAHTELNGLRERGTQKPCSKDIERGNPQEIRSLDTDKPSNAGSHVSNSEKVGIQRLRTSREQESQTHESKAISLRTSQRGYWAVEPELGRVAHGIPNILDRGRI